MLKTVSTLAGGGGGTGTVTSVSVVSANGLAGTVATATTTPAITLSTTVTGLLKGNGTAISAATSGTDYAPATSGSSILYGNGLGGFSNVTIGSGVSFSGGILSATGSGGTVTSVGLTAPSFLSVSGSPVTGSGTLALTLSGTALPTTSGGTGLTSFTANGVLYASSSSALATGSALTFDGTTLASIGSGDRVKFGTGSRNLYVAGDSGGVSLFDGAAQTGNGWYISGASNYVAGYISSSEQMRLTSTGLGIGTSSPAYKLDVSTSGTAAARFTGAANVYADVTDGTGNFRIQLLSNVPNIGSSTNHNLNLITNNSVKATLDTSGNLGLGVTPSAWSAGKAFQLGASGDVALWDGNGGAARLMLNSYFNGGYKYKTSSAASLYEQYNGAHAWYTAASGTAGNAITFTQAMTLDASGNLLIGTTSTSSLAASGRGLIEVNGSSDSAFAMKVGNTLYGYLYNSSSEFRVANITANPITFFTNNTERARIDSSGNLLVGKTSFTATSPGFMTDQGGALYVTKASSTNADATYYLYSSGASAYRFYVGMDGTVNATNTTISAISDQRFKENIRDLDIGLNAVMALKPRKFDWKAGKGKDIKNDRGFIAQEFETVFPDLIDEWKDPAPEGEEPYKSVRQDLIPVLVKAIQEQQAIIEQLKADVAALKGA